MKMKLYTLLFRLVHTQMVFYLLNSFKRKKRLVIELVAHYPAANGNRHTRLYAL